MVGTRRSRFKWRIARESARAAELGARKGEGERPGWNLDVVVVSLAVLAVGEVDMAVMPTPARFINIERQITSPGPSATRSALVLLLH